MVGNKCLMCHVNMQSKKDMPVEERSVFYACTFDALKSYFDHREFVANRNGRVVFDMERDCRSAVVLEVAFCEIESLLILGFLPATKVCDGCGCVNEVCRGVPFEVGRTEDSIGDQTKLCLKKLDVSYEKIKAVHVKDDASKAIVKAFMSSRPLTQKIEIIVDGR